MATRGWGSRTQDTVSASPPLHGAFFQSSVHATELTVSHPSKSLPAGNPHFRHVVTRVKMSREVPRGRSPKQPGTGLIQAACPHGDPASGRRVVADESSHEDRCSSHGKGWRCCCPAGPGSTDSAAASPRRRQAVPGA